MRSMASVKDASEPSQKRANSSDVSSVRANWRACISAKALTVSCGPSPHAYHAIGEVVFFGSRDPRYRRRSRAAVTEPPQSISLNRRDGAAECEAQKTMLSSLTSACSTPAAWMRAKLSSRSRAISSSSAGSRNSYRSSGTSHLRLSM